jgi:hypothetical protein
MERDLFMEGIRLTTKKKNYIGQQKDQVRGESPLLWWLQSWLGHNYETT